MKKLSSLWLFLPSLLILSPSENLTAQNVEGKALYLKFYPEKKELRYFTSKDDIDEDEPLEKKHTLSVGSQFTKVYIGWFNPLKYQIIWKDTSYQDSRDKIVQDYTSLLMGQLGLPNTPVGESKMTRIIASEEDETIAEDKGSKYDKQYYDSDLAELKVIFDLYKSEAKLTQLDSVQLNIIEKILEELDKVDYNNAYDYLGAVKNVYSELFSINNYAIVMKTLKEEKSKIIKLKARFDEIRKEQKIIPGLLVTATEGSLTIYNYVNNVVANYLNKVKIDLEKNEALVSKTEPLFNKILNSINDSSSINGYYHIKDIKFDEGSVFETGVIISEDQFEPEALEFTKNKVVYQSTIIFERYDWIQPTVSSGIFYSSVTIKGFGVAADGNGRLIVSEDTFTKNSPVTGLFLNLNFNLASRYFSPCIQIGIDPTKSHPYFLMGLGFSIPTSKFSITGGPLWAWSPRLEDLSVGAIVNSTTELEKKIKYDINIAPNGWYIGFLYNL